MKLEDVQALSGRLFAAAETLLSSGFHNQAVARAYYGAYVVLDFWARRQGVYAWPDHGGKQATHIPHSQAHTWFAYAFAQHGVVTTKAMQPPNAEQAGYQLKEQRILADYRTHLEIPEGSAKKMVRNARELYSVLIVEAGKVKDNPPSPPD